MTSERRDAAASTRAGRDGSPLARAYAEHRYAILFYTLLAALGVGPLLAPLRFGSDLLQIVLALSLLIAVLDVPAQRWRRALLLLTAAVIAIRAAPLSVAGGQVTLGVVVAGTAIALVAAASAIRFALRTGRVETEHVYAALSAYLLAGQFFGLLYWALAAAWPGSLADAGAAAGAPGVSLSTAIYFSFVTLATLGYGDVVPRSEVARGLAVLEAVGGQLYVAVLIARLVGARLLALADPDESGDSAAPGAGREVSTGRTGPGTRR